MKQKPTKNTKESDPGTRERIVEAACELFAQQGFASTSTRAIAAKAGCNLSLIQYYFGSKEGLLDEVGKAMVLRVRGAIEQVSQGEGPAEERLDAFIGFIMEILTQNKSFLELMMKVFFSENREIPEQMKEITRGNADRAEAMIRRMQMSGMVRADLNPRLCAVLLMGMSLFYFIANPITSVVAGPPTPELIESLRRHVFEVFLHGVATVGTPGTSTDKGGQS